MNEKKEWKERLELANNDLKQYGIWLVIEKPEEGFFSLIIAGPGLDDRYTFAENYYENELGELINDAHVHARARGEHLKRRDLPVLDRKLHLFCESVQEVTLCAWPIIWADNKYDQDSRVVLETILGWAWEFEIWWLSHGESWRDRHDYIEEVVVFTRNKCKEYLKELGVEPEPAKEPEPEPEVRGHIEETIDIMLDIARYAEERFATDVRDRDVEHKLTKEWAREFSKWYYCELTDDERIKKGYYAELMRFLYKKFEEYKNGGAKDYIVHITRTEKYKADVLVSATSEEEAEKKVEEAWGDGKHDWLYEKMTENINCDSQTYKARQAYSTEEHYDFSI